MEIKKLAIGILAHVDAGKTTLSESMLYSSGSIRKIGRVDRGDAFLDTYELEKARGITIFSKQAILQMGDTTVTLLDAEGVSLSSWSLTDGQSINISAKDIATSTGTIRITGDGVSEDRAVSFTKQ